MSHVCGWLLGGGKLTLGAGDLGMGNKLYETNQKKGCFSAKAQRLYEKATQQPGNAREIKILACGFVLVREFPPFFARSRARTCAANR